MELRQMAVEHTRRYRDDGEATILDTGAMTFAEYCQGMTQASPVVCGDDYTLMGLSYALRLSICVLSTHLPVPYTYLPLPKDQSAADRRVLLLLLHNHHYESLKPPDGVQYPKFTGSDLFRLSYPTPLNDQVLNAYGAYLPKRALQWTQKHNIMGKRSLFIPVFSHGHWKLVSVIDSHVVYWNSSKGIGLEAMKVLKQIETFLCME
ncbi:hypothetical protein PsorP6_002900 [Peronosclerospora sorghi]|uniref:Uncharacterized protein n=1 Tax=Peronosclerospora sorghi TaxID=230839 RepID=A0ACC0VK38_9STRA|nr:hypothetical protein PsorP6_002900 [Peronosclerospora sorghi]